MQIRCHKGAGTKLHKCSAVLENLVNQHTRKNLKLYNRIKERNVFLICSRMEVAGWGATDKLARK